MARNVCLTCNRPQKVCVCHFIRPIDNEIEIGILQHPSEAKNVKGTAILAALSLQKCTLWVAEKIDDVPELKAWLEANKTVYLLYPANESQLEIEVVSATNLSTNNPADYKVLVLDGTWRKTFKMMQINPELQCLPRVSIELVNASEYIIRKQKNVQSLSTVEAMANLLSELENNNTKFLPLHTAFTQMQQQQMAFRKP